MPVKLNKPSGRTFPGCCTAIAPSREQTYSGNPEPGLSA